MANYRQVSRYGLGLTVNKSNGWIHLWFSDGSADPKVPDFKATVEAATLAAAATLLQNDRDRTVYFDPASQQLASGIET